MDLNALKLQNLGIDQSLFGKIYTFVDFGNVNRWFNKDIWGWNGYKLANDENLIIDIEKMAYFIELFSEKKYFYYGFNQNDESSLHITVTARRSRFITRTKPIQWIKHYLSSEEISIYTNPLLNNRVKTDRDGSFINIPKCNFDVEMCLDIVRLKDKYDTACVFTSDNDFSPLFEYLIKSGKKVILIHSNPVRETLLEKASLKIVAQDIKSSICGIKKTSESFSEYKKRTLP